MSRGFTEAEIAEVWERRGAGEPTRSIARRLGRNGSSIRRIFEDAGGVCPAPRHRADRHLSLTEREEISRGIAAGESLRAIAGRLGRAASTVSRELARNGGRLRYRAHRADRALRKQQTEAVHWYQSIPVHSTTVTTPSRVRALRFATHFLTGMGVGDAIDFASARELAEESLDLARDRGRSRRGAPGPVHTGS